MPIPNVHDGRGTPPRLRRELNLGTVWDLPPWSAGPRGDTSTVLHAVLAAGYEAVQGGDPARCAEVGLACSTFGAVHEPGQLRTLAPVWRDLGFTAATLHVGTGLEDDDRALALLEEVVTVADDLGFPLYVETHRATVTQDLWRTVGFVERLPELRFNADLSHWYTGLEMTYGDFEAKVGFASPVLERSRFVHGRIGDPGCIQVDVGAEADHPCVAHFRTMWTAVAAGFLTTARPGDVLPFAPELLPPSIHYGRTEPDPDVPGTRRESSDRWTQALVLCDIAEACFAAAEAELATATRATTPAAP